MPTGHAEDEQTLASKLDDAAAPAEGGIPNSGITCDNLHLSKPIGFAPVLSDAVIADSETTDAKLLRFLQAARAPNTRRAYECDLEHFLANGGELPATELIVARYLASHAGVLAIATLRRRLVAIRSAHILRGMRDPTHSELVRLTFRGIRRTHGAPQRRVAALTVPDLRAIVSALGASTREIRDRAIILVGFAGAFRRSELVAIDCKDIDLGGEGAVIRIRRGKTDQQGKGRAVTIPRGQGKLCPVAALARWLSAFGTAEGAVFRAVTKSGRILPVRLSSASIAIIIKARVQSIGKDASRYSGHSLRAGFVTAAAIAGVPQWRIKAQTGHLSDAVLAGYIRAGELTAGSALEALFE